MASLPVIVVLIVTASRIGAIVLLVPY